MPEGENKKVKTSSEYRKAIKGKLKLKGHEFKKKKRGDKYVSIIFL